nr:uncharacterized protein LOC113692313 [Coffea arabica]
MKVGLKTKEELKPWEQHSAVITIPRFDYNAPSSLLSLSHSGFLVTCPITKKRRTSVSTEEELGNSLERKDAANDFGEPVAVWLLYLLVLSKFCTMACPAWHGYIFHGNIECCDRLD